MYAQVDKPKENKSKAVANSVAQRKSTVMQGFGFVDNRFVIQKKREMKPVCQLNGDSTETFSQDSQSVSNESLSEDNKIDKQSIGWVQVLIFKLKNKCDDIWKEDHIIKNLVGEMYTDMINYSAAEDHQYDPIKVKFLVQEINKIQLTFNTWALNNTAPEIAKKQAVAIIKSIRAKLIDGGEEISKVNASEWFNGAPGNKSKK